MRSHNTIFSLTLITLVFTLVAIVFLWFSLKAVLLVLAALKMLGLGERFAYALGLLR